MRPGRRFSDALPGCGLPAAWSAETSAVWVFPQPGLPATESSFSYTPLWPRRVTSPLSLSFLICKAGTVTEPMSQSCEDA